MYIYIYTGGESVTVTVVSSNIMQDSQASHCMTGFCSALIARRDSPDAPRPLSRAHVHLGSWIGTGKQEGLVTCGVVEKRMTPPLDQVQDEPSRRRAHG